MHTSTNKTSMRGAHAVDLRFILQYIYIYLVVFHEVGSVAQLFVVPEIDGGDDDG
jgi:hypothetical protein